MPNSAHQPPALPESARLLVVGQYGALAQDLAAAPQTIVYLPFAALDAATLLMAAPDLVVCALFADEMATGDAVAVVERLVKLKYAQRILVICPSLPSLAMIEAELQAMGPGPKLRLIARD